MQGITFCILLIGTENELLPSLKKVANTVLVALCDPKPSYESAIATRNDKAIADILLRLYPSKASPNRTISAKCAVLSRMMSFIVEQCQPWCINKLNTVLKLHQAKAILDSLHRIVNRSSVSLCIFEFAQLGYVPEWWDSEVTFPLSLQNGEVGNCIGEEICSKSLDKLRSELATSFSSLLLTVAWHSSKSLQNPETCQRLLNRLKRSALSAPDLSCSYSANQTMGLPEDTGALADAQAECQTLHELLENESAQRAILQDQVVQSQKLLEQERHASNALEQYLDSAEREGDETAKALRSAREDYAELLHNADRKVQATESKWRQEELFLRADYLRRESELEDEVEELRSLLERKDVELEHEKQRRATHDEGMETRLAQSQEQVGGYVNHIGILLMHSTDKGTASGDCRQGQGLRGGRLSKDKANGTPRGKT